MRTSKHSPHLVALAVGAWLALAGTAPAQIPQGDLRIDLEPVVDSLTSPVFATHAGDGSGRLFVVDQVGQIRIVKDGMLLAEPFLDLSDVIVPLNPIFDERGVLGLAFHPDYESNGRFFVRYSAPREGDPDEPCADPGGFVVGCHTAVLAEFHVSAGDPDVADPAGTILFEADQPQFNHNAGHVEFGPDGLLYFSLGDGGGAHDGLADDPVSHGPIGHGQNIFTALGSLLRIDVDEGVPYAVPDDNPFVGEPGVDEIYAYGLRNPYRFSFDDEGDDEIDEVEDARLFLADVGQNLFEEIDLIQRGGNYGWVIREGANCFDPFNPTMPPADCSTTGPLGEQLLDPIAEYDHEDGIAVVGGSVYRGAQSPALVGKYVFGDFIGRLFYIDTDLDLSQIFEFQLGESNEPLGLLVFGFGEDEDGEIYLLTSQNFGPNGNTGAVFRVVSPDGVDPGEDEDEDRDIMPGAGNVTFRQLEASTGSSGSGNVTNSTHAPRDRPTGLERKGRLGPLGRQDPR